jgi:hypothetical protein
LSSFFEVYNFVFSRSIFIVIVRKKWFWLKLKSQSSEFILALYFFIFQRNKKPLSKQLENITTTCYVWYHWFLTRSERKGFHCTKKIFSELMYNSRVNTSFSLVNGACSVLGRMSDLWTILLRSFQVKCESTLCWVFDDADFYDPGNFCKFYTIVFYYYWLFWFYFVIN